MSDQNPKELNEERRKLLIATGGVGALGAAAFVTPMVKLKPSETSLIV